MTDKPTRLIANKIKSNRRELSKLYLMIEIERKLLRVIKKYDLIINYLDNTLLLKHYLSEDAPLARTAWQIFEEIDEILDTEHIQQATFKDQKDYDITANCCRVAIRFSTYYGNSKVYKEVEVTKTITVH